jgi:hypothetical protein
MSFKLKEIKRILKEHDVRDPRGCLLAIEKVVFQKNPEKKIKPVLVLTVTDHDNHGEVEIKSRKDIQPRAVALAIDGLRELANRKSAESGECKGCSDLPPVKELLAHLFAQFEAEQQAKHNKEGK